MQKQRKDYISSPTVRDKIQMAPTSSPRLSWTRRQVSAPAPAERREAARVPQEAEATRARRMSGRSPLPPMSCALGESYAILAAPSRNTLPPTFSRAGERRRTWSRSSPASCQSLHPYSLGRPVSSYVLRLPHSVVHISTKLSHMQNQRFCQQQTEPGNQKSVRVSSSLHSHLASIQRKDTAARWKNHNHL